MKKYTLEEIAKLINGDLKGDARKTITSIKGLASASAADISFIYDKRYLDDLKKTKAGCIIVNNELKSLVTSDKIIVNDPNSAVVKLCNELFQINKPSGISKLASIDKSASVGQNCYIGEFCYIGKNVKIGNNTLIYPGTTIGDSSTIGDNCIVYSNVSIYHNVIIKNNVIVHSGAVIGADGFGFTRDEKIKIPQIGTVEICDDVEIGANVTIDRARLDKTFIGAGTKIDNQVHIAHNVSIGKNCIIIAQTGISGSCVIEDNVIIGGQVGIAEKVRIGAGSIIYHQSGVTKNVPPKKLLAGTPAMDKLKHHRMHAKLKKIALGD